MQSQIRENSWDSWETFFSDTLRAPQKLISLQIPTSYLLPLISYLLSLT